MRKSRYATHVELADGEHVLFNAATGRFAACDGTHAEAFERAGRSCEGGARAGAGAGAERALADAGFLVEDGFDEVAAQRAAFEAFRSDASVLHLSLAPTYACNCRCAYCYEQDKATAKSIMGPEVEDAVYAFVRERHAATGFTSLFVEWYGGEPQLCLDLVERMAGNLAAFCDERGISYDSMMLSNATRIGQPEADLIARARVSSVMVTVDGPEDLHNERRPAVDVENAFEAVMRAIGCLQQAGVYVAAAMNADKVNMARLPELRALLREQGVEVAPVKLNDYSHTYNCPGEARFCSPAVQLYTHREFAHANYEALRDAGLTAAQLGEMLKPSDHFCSGHMNSSYVVDAFGDVYKCDGWMGDRSRRLFNLLDGSPWVHDAITFDPFEDERCRECRLLPLCWGNCSWERELCDWPCHPLMYAMDRYLESYRACFPARKEPFEVLA